MSQKRSRLPSTYCTKHIHTLSTDYRLLCLIPEALLKWVQEKIGLEVSTREWLERSKNNGLCIYYNGCQDTLAEFS